ncbi:MAG: hypothetical protein HY727_14005 [Candidatus Rokubacteria bacterium]|nr:hypothetical protein [Candidatus Rokubacteria bacterium]
MIAALAVLLASSGAAAAASFALSEAQKREALRAGQRSVTVESFDTEWRVANGSGESVTVITPFHRLAIAARHAAFRNEPLKPDEPEKLLREQGDRVLFWVSLQGPREDFARFLTPRILVEDHEIEPAFVQNERTALREESGTFLARCVYGFATRDLSGSSRVVLVVRDADGRDVRRFTIDLATMR